MSGTIIYVIVGVLLLMLLVLWLFGERGRPMLPSTWKTMRAGGLRGFLNLSGFHGYIYGRWTHKYISMLIHYIFPRWGPRGKKWLADRYHGKVLTEEQARAIITLNKDIPLQDLEQIIPYAHARNLVLKGPPDVVVFECGCRHARTSPCRPTQVCMVIGQPLADFVLEHQPQRSRRITQEEALEILQAEHKRGHLHSAWFKDACLNRFYAICNCCKCCCGGIEAMAKHGARMMAPSGYAAQVDANRCLACGTCVDSCPFHARSLKETSVVLDWEKCMGCGVCVGQCPNAAISLVRDEGKGIPLDVRLLA